LTQQQDAANFLQFIEGKPIQHESFKTVSHKTDWWWSYLNSLTPIVDRRQEATRHTDRETDKKQVETISDGEYSEADMGIFLHWALFHFRQTHLWGQRTGNH